MRDPGEEKAKLVPSMSFHGGRRDSQTVGDCFDPGPAEQKEPSPRPIGPCRRSTRQRGARVDRQSRCDRV
jgi:hypothetical protein